MNTKGKTNQGFQYEILGSGVFESDKEIKSSRLPTRKLFFFLAHSQTVSNREAANATATIIKEYYDKARIPSIAFHKIAEAVLKLHTDFKDLRRIEKPLRDNSVPNKQCQRIEDYKNDLQKTFKVWPRNALEKISIEEDRQFLISMDTDRVATMTLTTDDTLFRKESSYKKRKDAEQKRIADEKTRCETAETVCVTETECVEDEDEEDDDPEYVNSENIGGERKHRRSVKTGINIFMPHDILRHPKVVQSLVRNSISSSAIASVLRSIIEGCNGDPSKVVLSYTQIERYKVETVTKIYEDIQENWTPSNVSLIHWDGKLMDTLDSSMKSERLPILLSGENGIKLLGVPEIPTKSTEGMGKLISQSSLSLLEEWKCKSSVKGMVFDTTSANTGAQTAGCISMQHVLNRPLLWIACRHHVGEVVLSHVWDALKIEASKSPDVSLFTRFKEQFATLTHSDIQIKDIPECLKTKREAIISLCRDYSLLKNLHRGDYKELVSLTLLYLNADEDGHEVKFQKPGALHKARWMSKLIYSIKIDLLSKQIMDNLPKGSIFSVAQKPLIERFVQFVIFVYVPWWLTCPIAANAPKNDLILLNSILDYQYIDGVISCAALKSLKNHLWYLTQELTPLVLFSEQVTDSEKENIVKVMQQNPQKDDIDNRHGAGFGKPCFPDVDQITYDLSQFVGSDSWQFFKILDIDSSFMSKKVED